MITRHRTRRAPFHALTPHEETVTAALAAVDLVVHAERRAAARAAEPDWDEVHDAALESFPASDAPSWGALRVGPPASDRFARAGD